MRLSQAIYGIPWGNFDPNAYDSYSEFLGRVDSVAKTRHGLEFVFMPRIGMTNRIIKLGEEDEHWSREFSVSQNPADGIIINKPKTAVLFPNADCPVVSVLEHTTGRMAGLHCGFRCLVPQTYRGQREPSIIQQLFHKHGFAAANCTAFYGYGAGPCCYGSEHWKEEINDYSLKYLKTGRVTRCERRIGQRSFDLFELIRAQLLDEGIVANRIYGYSLCTSCYYTEFPSKLAFHSHCRDDSPNKIVSGRNAALLWYE